MKIREKKHRETTSFLDKGEKINNNIKLKR